MPLQAGDVHTASCLTEIGEMGRCRHVTLSSAPKTAITAARLRWPARLREWQRTKAVGLTNASRSFLRREKEVETESEIDIIRML